MQHKHTAQGLASLGRGPDTELVHMTKGEVHGLQQLAMAHGGSLTINPETGLAEAGFLSSILPMVVGAGLMFATGGTAAPLIAGLSNAATIGIGMGGLTTLATGSLSKGLMAGLGAYGGAGMLGGVMGAGAAEAAGSAMAGAPPAVAPAAAPTLGNAVGTAAAETAATNAASVVPGAADGLQPFYQSQLNSQLNPMVNAQLSVPTTPMPLGPTDAAALRMPSPYDQMVGGLKNITSSGSNALGFAKDNAMPLGALGISALGGMDTPKLNAPATNQGMIRPYTFNRTQNAQPDALTAQYVPGQSTRERQYFNDQYVAGTPYKAPGPEYMADGGAVNEAVGGAVGSGVADKMSGNNIMGVNTGYPMANIYAGAYSAPDSQQPPMQNMGQSAPVNNSTQYIAPVMFAGGGGISSLGGYSDGGQLLRGPGDGVSDSIPAQIGDKQPARLADGEFVVSADVVSGLGNGSTEAGAKQLYAMMERVRKARTGTKKMGKTANANKMVPA